MDKKFPSKIFNFYGMYCSIKWITSLIQTVEKYIYHNLSWSLILLAGRSLTPDRSSKYMCRRDPNAGDTLSRPIDSPALVLWRWKAAFELHTVNTSVYGSKQCSNIITGGNVHMNRLFNVLKLIFYYILVKYIVLPACNILKSFSFHTCSINLHKTQCQCKLSGAHEVKMFEYYNKQYFIHQVYIQMSFL